MQNVISVDTAHRKALAVVKKLPAATRREISTARLPFNYEAAQLAVAECARVDECKEWANKAEAIASYARQINDFTMGNNARRVILRATRRIGELIYELNREVQRTQKAWEKGECSTDEWETGPKAQEHSRVCKDRQEAISSVSTRKRNIAVALANIPTDKFESYCEAPNVLTPHSVLVAEGNWGTGGSRRKPLEVFVTALSRISDLEKSGELDEVFEFIKTHARKELRERVLHIGKILSDCK